MVVRILFIAFIFHYVCHKFALDGVITRIRHKILDYLVTLVDPGLSHILHGLGLLVQGALG